MTEYNIFILYLIGCGCSFLAGCLIVDSLMSVYKKKKAQRLELETLRRENYRLKAVIECYETWNIKI